jgi:hypothetical protein
MFQVGTLLAISDQCMLVNVSARDCYMVFVLFSGS